MEYLTTYPKTISFIDGLKHKIHVDNKEGVEHLTFDSNNFLISRSPTHIKPIKLRIQT